MISTILKCFSRFCIIGLLFFGRNLFAGEVTILDSQHYSNVFGEMRNFRIFLPPGYYDNPRERYPVIYFYHGWSQRYFGSGPDGYNSYEKGDDNNGDNIAAFVMDHEVIVVKPDGYNRSPGEEYYLRPYNIGPVETFRQYPIYFPELVSFIDSNYRTIADRNHRAISGLSMGGFMCFWIGGKYPQLVSAIGNFCGSAEFVAGPKDFPVEYRHIDMYKNYDGLNVRLNYGNEDFIRYYHRDLNRIWLSVMDNYEYKIYPAAHSTCGMREMFGFLMKSFENPPGKPARWNHIDVYPEFSVWDYDVTSDRNVPGFTILENVDSRGFRCAVRDHLPDGGLLPFVRVMVTTPPIYERNTLYAINDIDERVNKASSYKLKSDDQGKLRISFNGSSHEIGINTADERANICLESFAVVPANIAESDRDVDVKISLMNKGNGRGERIKASLFATRNSCSVIKGESDFGIIEICGVATAKNSFVFHVRSDTVEIEKFRLKISDKSQNEWVEFFEIPIYRRDLPEIKDFEIADGRVVTVAKEGIHEETLSLGTGNGDGIPNPGESIVILVKDKERLWRTNLTCDSKYINPFGINTRYSDNWGSYDHVGGSAKYSVPLIASESPAGSMVSFIAEYWLPDYPNHIIKQGWVTIKISGEDKTPPGIQWVRVTGDNVIQARLFDGSAIGNVTARLVLKAKPDRFLEFELKDDGTNSDVTGSDNVFSCKVPEQKFGIYTVEITAADTYGNIMQKTADGSYVFH
jgi:S-formylglutathione hydrolase FrmB